MMTATETSTETFSVTTDNKHYAALLDGAAKSPDITYDREKIFNQKNKQKFHDQLLTVANNLKSIAANLKQELDKATKSDLETKFAEMTDLKLKKEILKDLLKNNSDLLAELGLGKKTTKAPANTPKNSNKRVVITVNGKAYDMPIRGNMSEELKALVKADGGDRDAFIAKYRNEPAKS